MKSAHIQHAILAAEILKLKSLVDALGVAIGEGDDLGAPHLASGVRAAAGVVLDLTLGWREQKDSEVGA